MTEEIKMDDSISSLQQGIAPVIRGGGGGGGGGAQHHHHHHQQQQPQPRFVIPAKPGPSESMFFEGGEGMLLMV